MDNSFGHQEFLATLSQSSNRSSSENSNCSTRNHSSKKSNNNNNNTATTTSQYQQQQFALSSMDEQAVRRLGRKLSLQAHGGGPTGMYPPPPPPAVITIEATPESGFDMFSKKKNAASQSASTSSTSNNSNLLQVVTVHCKSLYTQIRAAQLEAEQYHPYDADASSAGLHPSSQRQQQHRTRNAHSSTRSSSNKQSCRADSDTAMLDMVHESIRQRRANTTGGSKKGLLSAVFESGGSDSTTTATASTHRNPNQQHPQHHQHQRNGSGGTNSQNTRTIGGGDSTASPGTISTKETGYNFTDQRSKGSYQSQQHPSSSSSHHPHNTTTSASHPHHHHTSSSTKAPDYVRGPCLTEPSAGVANDGCDNQDGNLIVHANDLIVVPRKNVRTLSRHNKEIWKQAEFRVQALQGQGTFAQVFSCLHVPSGQMVALKIIKNKSTYTRQAAMEIDIFQSLVESGGDGGRKGKSSSSSGGGGGGTGKDKQQQQPTSESSQSGLTNNYRDYMVGLKAYFMHLDHLCLVFELLGMNLYDVLKAREFRGLPLRVVRELSRQTVMSIKYFSQKNVVHCDLKPENILMATTEIGKKLMQEGSHHHGFHRSSSDSSGYPKRGKAGGNTCSQTTTSQTKSSGTGTDTDSDKVMASTTSSSGGGSVKSGAGQTTISDDSSNSQAKTCVTNDESGEGSGSGGGTNSGSQSNSGSGGSSRKSGEVISSSSSSTVPMANPGNTDPASYKIKLIDFGSACFEGHTSHSYIQSRFYRSPEVLIGLPYDSAIDMWSLGCIAAELFLGLPILPGAHEHDQLVRINEMISNVPEWMLEQGSKAKKCYVKYFPTQQQQYTSSGSTVASNTAPVPAWRLKTHEEYIVSLSQAEVRKKGGREKLSQPPKNRYFKRKRLSDIILLHAQHEQQQQQTQQDGGLLAAFIHFLYGVLDPDPWKRLTAFQAAQHPFITGDLTHLRPRQPDLELNRKEENQANLLLQIYWAPPWDPTICRRKLQNVQKIRERQNNLRRHSRSSSRSPVDSSVLHNDRHRRMASSSFSEQSLCESMATSVQISQQQQQQQQQQPYPPSPMQMSAATPPIGVSESSSNTSSNMMLSSHATPLGYGSSSGQQQHQRRSMQQQPNQYADQRSLADGMMGQFQPGMMMAMDSSQVTASYASMDGGESYSIERPGFFPGSYGVETNSQSSVASYQSGSTHSTSQRNSAFGGSYHNRKSSYGQSVHHHHQQQQHHHYHESIYLGSHQQQQHSMMAPPQVVIPGQLGDAVSVTSSIAMSEQPAMIDPQQLALFQQQMAFFQQQQQQFGFFPSAVPMQPELQPPTQQPPMTQQPQQAMPPSLQQQALPTPQQQQQPVMMMQNTTNGGFYYVTTSANGQPVLLQPVGMWNQQQQQQQPQVPGQYPGAAATGATFVPQPPPPYQQPPMMGYPQQQQQQQPPPYQAPPPLPQQPRRPPPEGGPNNANANL